MSISAYVGNAVRRFGSRTALIEGGRRWTFAELDSLVERLARGLAACLPPGGRVGLFMANRAEYILLQMALERASLVRVPLNARYTAFEVANVVKDCGAQALFFDSATAKRVDKLSIPGFWYAEVASDNAQGGPSWAALIRLGERSGPAAPPDYDDLCSINYTSGSSGEPKGVMLTHRKWFSVYKNMLIDRDIWGSDRLAHVGPLTHASGTYVAPFFLRGATNIVVEGGRVEALLEAIERHKVTAFTLVPTVLTRIVNHPGIDGRDLSSLRWISYGAEAIQTHTLEKALALFGPILSQNYGLTEAMMTCSQLLPQEHFLAQGDFSALRLGTIGRPYSFVDIELRDCEGRPVPDQSRAEDHHRT